MADELRRGALSNKERQIIKDNIGRKTPEELAHLLKRPIVQIQNQIKKFGGDSANFVDAYVALRKMPEYQSLKEELTKQELVVFENGYARWVSQVEGDMVASERSQVFLLIKQEILMSKLMKQRKYYEECIEEVEEQIKETKESDLEMNERKQRLYELREEKSGYANWLTGCIKTIREMMKEHDLITKSLKGTRDQRFKNIDNRKHGFMELMKQTSNQVERDRMGIEAELNKLAAEEEKRKMSEPHVFLDNVADFPYMSGKEAIVIK